MSSSPRALNLPETSVLQSPHKEQLSGGVVDKLKSSSCLESDYKEVIYSAALQLFLSWKSQGLIVETMPSYKIQRQSGLWLILLLWNNIIPENHMVQSLLLSKL